MPMIEVVVPEGTLDGIRRGALIKELTAAVLKVEGVPDSPQARALTWVFVNEAPRDAWAAGGASPSGPRFLVRVTVPVGTLSVARKRRMGLDVYKLLSRFSGKDLSPDEAWIIVYEVPEGHWTAGGKVLRLADISTFMGMTAPRKRLRG